MASSIGQVPPTVEEFFDRVRPVVDDAISKLAAAEFREDPIAGRKYSRATSIVSSAYKRHGAILQRALLERLKDCPRLRVWTEDEFKLSHESLRQVRIAERLESLLDTRLPYGDRERIVRADVLVFDEEDHTLKAYNVKRGNGSYDAGKKRAIHEELVRTQMVLNDYGRRLGLPVEAENAHIVFYYGLMSLPPPLAISGEDLDSHFRYSVRGAIEIVNTYFVSQLIAHSPARP